MLHFSILPGENIYFTGATRGFVWTRNNSPTALLSIWKTLPGLHYSRHTLEQTFLTGDCPEGPPASRAGMPMAKTRNRKLETAISPGIAYMDRKLPNVAFCNEPRNRTTTRALWNKSLHLCVVFLQFIISQGRPCEIVLKTILSDKLILYFTGQAIFLRAEPFRLAYLSFTAKER